MDYIIFITSFNKLENIVFVQYIQIIKKKQNIYFTLNYFIT